MFESHTINFSDKELTDGNAWAHIEQEYKNPEDDKADLSDLAQMLALVNSGVTATNHIRSACSYAEVIGDTVVVSLDFFVWPYDIMLPYNLKADLGEISVGTLTEEDKSFDVVLRGASHQDLPFIFKGTFTPEMPYFSSVGKEVPAPTITVNSSEILVDPPVTTILRAEGKATGFRHTIKMTLVKANPADGPHSDSRFKTVGISNAGAVYDHVNYPVIYTADAIEESWLIDFTNSTSFILYDSVGRSVGHGNIGSDFVTQHFTLRSEGWSGPITSSSYVKFTTALSDGIDKTGYKIENLRNTIVLSWVDEKGKPRDETLELEIPPCVEALLEECPGGGDTIIIIAGPAKYKYVCYYSTCDGEVIEVRSIKQ